MPAKKLREKEMMNDETNEEKAKKKREKEKR